MPLINRNGALPASITFLGDIGAQAVNMSWGSDPATIEFCESFPDEALCLAIEYVSTRKIALIGASGNNRARIQFPARDSRVIAAGGFDEQLQLWDESPGSTTDCPFGPDNASECGSNWTFSAGFPRQEVVAASRNVFGLVYPGMDWSILGCGDSIGPGPTDDGLGNCTGTSMSAPQVTGIIGLMRSVNPLVGLGEPDFDALQGIRTILAQTTFKAQSGQPWEPQLGHGWPDAELAVRTMLGTVGGQTIRNRATPLFSFYGSGTQDHAYTTSPQKAISLMINNAANYQPLGSVVPGYESFPSDPLISGGEVPRTNIFVMTTEHKTDPDHPDLVPLFLADRSRRWPIGCNPSSPDCNLNNRDFLLATSKPELEVLYASGYDYRGIEGYVFERCSPEPGCIPEGAQPLWRKCNVDEDDCAIFLEEERAAYEAAGYTQAFPVGFSMHLGYAYPNIDTDGDGLIDGFELLIGTDPTLADTDGDGIPDGIEFPLAGVSISDPCDGPLANRCHRVNRIFTDRFED